MKKVVFTRHTEDAIRERGIDAEWVVRAAVDPEWTKPDPDRPGIEKRFRSMPERGDRVLRVACFETDDEIRIVTAFFDRHTRRQR